MGRSAPAWCLCALLLGACAANPHETSQTGDAALAAYRAGDFDRAADIWRERAAAGDVNAKVNLAYLYEQGKGVPLDRRRSIELYAQAAEAGDAAAQYQLGLMHELGLGVEADIDEAEYWYGQAIDQGYCPGEIRSPADVR